MPDQQEHSAEDEYGPPIDLAEAQREGAWPYDSAAVVSEAVQATEPMIMEDWSLDRTPPPQLGVEGVEPGEQHVPLVFIEPQDPGDRRVRNLTAAQARGLAAALTARADVIDPPVEHRPVEVGRPAPVVSADVMNELWMDLTAGAAPVDGTDTAGALDRLARWTAGVRNLDRYVRAARPTIAQDVETLLAVHPRAVATAADHGPADPFDRDGRVTFTGIARARDYGVRHGVSPALTHRVSTADLCALLDAFAAVAGSPDPGGDVHVGGPVRPDHPHRDTISTMLECAEWMPSPSSVRARLVVCARRLNAAQCRPEFAPRLHVGDVVESSVDGCRYTVLDTPPGRETAAAPGQVWAGRDGDEPVWIDAADLTLIIAWVPGTGGATQAVRMNALSKVALYGAAVLASLDGVVGKSAATVAAELRECDRQGMPERVDAAALADLLDAVVAAGVPGWWRP